MKFDFRFETFMASRRQILVTLVVIFFSLAPPAGKVFTYPAKYLLNGFGQIFVCTFMVPRQLILLTLEIL